MVSLSIIVPVLNEEGEIAPALHAMQKMRRRDIEVIVVDGGSRDRTVEIARPLADQVLAAPRGRASQMNAGAAIAKGRVLAFVHADTRLPGQADEIITAALRQTRHVWGRFDVALSGRHPLLRLVGAAMNARSRLTGIATGDQCLFMTGDAFDQVGGFPAIALMEDIAMSKRLKQLTAPACVRAKAITSGRRWEDRGVIRTVLQMWRLRLAYFFGADASALARRYYGA